MRIENGEIHVWTEEPTPDSARAYLSHAFPSARIKAIRTKIGDDEIEGYTLIAEVDGLRHRGSFMALKDIIKIAIAFWEQRLLH